MNDIIEKAHIFGSVFTLANRLQVLGDRMDPDLTVKQWLMIASITQYDSYAPTISEVADTIGNSRQNVKKMAAILEREGFLKLNKDADDARIVRISLTEKCETYFNNRAVMETEFIEQLFKNFDSRMVKELYRGISKLEENITEMENKYGKIEKE